MSLRRPGRFASITSSAPPIPETTRCGEPKLDGRSSKSGPGHKQLRHTWNGTESGSVWTLHAPARPAVPPQQLPGALHGVADVEQPPDQRLEPAECPPLVIGEPEAAAEPPATRQPGPAGFYATAVWLRAAFSGLRWEVHQAVEHDDLVVLHVTMSGRHTGNFVSYQPDTAAVGAVMPPTGKPFAVTQ